MNILIIEDNQLILDFMKEVVALAVGRDKCTIFTASTIEEGLNHLANNAMGLMVLDTEVGKETTLSRLGELRSFALEAPIIAMSGTHSFENQWIKEGAQVFLPKPLDLKKFSAAIKVALEKSSPRV